MSDGGDQRLRERAEIYPELYTWPPPKGDVPIMPPTWTFQCMTQRELADHQAAHPYRHLSVVDERRPARVEAAHCGWCRWGSERCGHSIHNKKTDILYGRVWSHKVNPRGECPHWSPSWLTRWARRLHLGRAPVMVDPRVYGEK